MNTLKLTRLFLMLPLTSQARNAPWVGADLKCLPCNGEGQGYGPYDYTRANERGKMPIVEAPYFTPAVENHIQGSGYLEGDRCSPWKRSLA